MGFVTATHKRQQLAFAIQRASVRFWFHILFRFLFAIVPSQKPLISHRVGGTGSRIWI